MASSNKITQREFAILHFMQDCPSGITTTECLRLFGTTELRKTVSKFRANGIPIKTVKEKNPKTKGWHNRYSIANEGRV